MYCINHYIVSRADCERLIRKMLHREPNKRLPLAKVLEHKWMEGEEPNSSATNQQQRIGSSDNLRWNEQVLRAIQGMNYSVDTCKQVGGCG